MKRILALSLCLVMLAAAFTGCATISQDDEDKGAIIPVYMTTEIYSLDPAYAYLDDAGLKILGLLYEGLFRVNDDGEIENALCDSYETGHNRDGEFFMEIALKDTRWSDGRSVTANDFVFAWKRIIEPESTSEAASMLYDIKNARECKLGDVSIDDFGVVASETKVLEITFERDIDVDLFIEYLASPALVPLREDKVTRLDDWASYYATMVTNGPFYPKVFIPGDGEMTIERSIYYYRDIESETQKLDKYVTPYRFVISFCTPEEALEKFEAGEFVYDSELPLASRSDYADEVKLQDTFSTASFYLNTAKAPFDDANVRRALSMAIDRNALADLVVYAEAAQGFIPDGVFNTSRKNSFREEGGSLISPTGDVDAAKALIKDASIASEEKAFTITIRDNEVDRAVAEYAADVWSELGFDVEIETLTFEHYLHPLEYDQYRDLFREAYFAREFDVIMVDAQALATDAFPTLAPFSLSYSGAAIDLASGDFSETPHVTGYQSEDYDALIEAAFAETDRAARASILHDAEKQLANDMPAIPLFVYKDAYIANDDLSKVKTTYFAYRNFNKTKLSDYLSYQTQETD